MGLDSRNRLRCNQGVPLTAMVASNACFFVFRIKYWKFITDLSQLQGIILPKVITQINLNPS